MLQSIRAIYKDGQLRPLEPVQLEDGQTVNLTIFSTEDPLTTDLMDARLRAAGLLAEMEISEAIEELTPEDRFRIGSQFVGDRSSEILIDEDRGLY